MVPSKIDKKILFELDKDGRASLSQIARNLGTTPQVVKYHYDRIMDMGLIKHFWAFVDYDKVGYSYFWGYFFRFSGMTQVDEDAMYEYLRGNTHIPIVMRVDGYAELHIAIIARDVFHHTEILNDFYAHFGKFISMSEIVVGTGFIKFPRNYLIEKENQRELKVLSGGTTNTIKLSELDRKIITFLLADGRMEFVQIARKLGVSTGLIHKHYYRLLKHEVITKITYTPNFQAMGIKHYRILVKILQYDEQRTDELYHYCARHPNIINYVKLIGNWELILEIEIANNDSLRDLLRDIRYRFKDVVTDIQKNEVYKIEKFTQMATEYPELLTL